MQLSDHAIRKQARDGLLTINNKVNAMLSKEYLTIGVYTGVTSNPPTNAELDALIDTPANIGTVAPFVVRDTVNGRYWGAICNPAVDEWYTWSLNLA